MSNNDEDSSPSHVQAGLPLSHSTKSFWHSQPSALLTGHRSTRNLPTEADIVIIGSGITGASVAHHLLSPNSDAHQDVQEQNGLNVVMLEAREACWGATGRNGGHCQPLLFTHPNDPSIGTFELRNFDTLRNYIEAHSVQCEWAVQPGIQAAYSQQALEAALGALHILEEVAPDQRKRIRLVTDKDELAKLRVPTAKAAVVTDVAARLWPYKLVAHILENLVSSHNLRNGGTFNLQTLTAVESLSPHTDTHTWEVKTPRGTILAKKVILATNGYTSHLLPSFASLIVPCRGQMSALTPPSSVSSDHRLQTSLGFFGDGLDDYLIQRPNESGGHLMFGGGRHEGSRSIGTVDDSVIDDATAMYLRSRLIEALGLKLDQGHRHLIPFFNHDSKVKELQAVAQWTGIMGYSRDDHPWVGAVPIQHAPGGPEVQSLHRGPHWKRQPDSGLFVSAGYTGHGMPNAWLCGKAVAMMVSDALTADPETSEPGAIETVVCDTVGLPKCYLVSDDRLRRAMDLESVAVQDGAAAPKKDKLVDLEKKRTQAVKS